MLVIESSHKPKSFKIKIKNCFLVSSKCNLRKTNRVLNRIMIIKGKIFGSRKEADEKNKKNVKAGALQLDFDSLVRFIESRKEFCNNFFSYTLLRQRRRSGNFVSYENFLLKNLEEFISLYWRNFLNNFYFAVRLVFCVQKIRIPRQKLKCFSFQVGCFRFLYFKYTSKITAKKRK